MFELKTPRVSPAPTTAYLEIYDGYTYYVALRSLTYWNSRKAIAIYMCQNSYFGFMVLQCIVKETTFGFHTACVLL